jgi:uncharacterized protein (TIGR03437 family)
MLRIYILFLIILPAFGQFTGLATTDDGKQFYFSTSLQLSGTTNENSYPKIFRYDNNGIRLVAQVDKVAIAPGIGTPSSNPYNLTSAYVSGNGSVFGYVGVADCNTGVPTCYYAGLDQTTLQYYGGIWPLQLPWGCSLSKNAQYAMCITGGRVTYEQYSLINLFGTGSPSSIPCGQATIYLPKPSSNGHVVCGNALASASGAVTLNLQGDSALLSDDGSRIVTQSGAALSVYNVAAGAQSTISFPNPQAAGAIPQSLSNDGSVVLFTLQSATAHQVASIHTDGTRFVPLTDDVGNATFVPTALSGDGSTAFVVTASGKLLKFDTSTGASTLITSGTQIQQVRGAAVAGSISSIQGTGLADATVSAAKYPLSTASLGGAQVTINGVPAPLLSVSPTSISFQIPWKAAPGNAAIAVVRPPSQFAQPPVQVQIQTIQPFAVFDRAISQDFSQLNDAMHPAMPGDIVNFYLTGLGAVTVPVADGALSPSNPLPRLIAPVTVSYGTTPLQVLYAGLAPGTVGVYQLTVRLPAVIAHNPLFPPGGETMVPLSLNSQDGVLPAVWTTTNQ